MSEQFTSLEWIEATRDAAVQLWRTSVLAMSESMPMSPKGLAEPHRRGLKQLVDELPNKPAPKQLEHLREKTVEIVKTYNTQMGAFIDSQEREARGVLSSVAQMTEALSGFDQRYSVRFQGIAKKLKLLASCTDLAEIRSKLGAEVSQLEKCLEEHQRDTRSAVQRISDDVNASEVRRQRALPGPGSQMVSDSLLALDRAIGDWDRYCIVRYEFVDRGGMNPDAAIWRTKETAMQEALPERVGHPVRVVSLKPGVILAAVHCQLLEYAGQAESMEKALSVASGLKCNSRVVEPLRGEAMREAVARLERAG